VDVIKGEIVISQPVGGLTVEVVEALGMGRGPAGPLGEARLREQVGRSRYTPVMAFAPLASGVYQVRRMTYRGKGGWSWRLAQGPLARLARDFVGKIGTEAFFELM
jgi:hypothetical protein